MKNSTILLFLLICNLFLLVSCKKDVKEKIIPPPPPPPTQTTQRSFISADLIAVGNLSQARSEMAVAVAGNNIVFAGGNSIADISSRVDIYNLTTSTWSTAELTQPRAVVAAANSGKKIYFAGGYKKINSIEFSSRVDIYDTEINEWSTKDLSPVHAVMTGASADDKVVFASGVTAFIFHASTNTWSTAPLSDRPGSFGPLVEGIAATVIGNSIYFAGGQDDSEVQNAIDIYNTTTNTWSNTFLHEYKGNAAGIAVDNTNYWAGGLTWTSSGYALSSQVEIRDMISGTVTFGNLFQGNSNFSAVQKNNFIVFFTGKGVEKNKFDIYDLVTKTWTVGTLPVTIEGAAIITVNNTIYVAGGKVNGTVSDKVWKLEF